MPRHLARTLCLILCLGVAGTIGATSLISPPECGSSTTTFTQSTPVAIPTGPAVVTSTVVVSGFSGEIWDVNVTTNIAHTFAADLDITVTSPAGTVVTLTTDNGAGNDNVFNGTVWDDDANPAGQVPYTTNNGLVTDHAYVNLTTASPLVPEEGLAAFIGEDPNGVWTITISDDLAGDGGSLNSWSLEITAIPTPSNKVVSTVTQSTPVAIPTGPAVVTSTIDASAVLGTFLCRARVTTNLTHTFSADLDMTVMSPAGTVVTLTTDNGAGNDNVFNGTEWRSDANPGGQVPYTSNNGMATDQAYVNLTTATPLTPEESLGAFNGEDPRGTWTLTVSDDLAGDGGSIDSWSLEIMTCSCAQAQRDNPVRVDEHVSSGSSNLNGVFELGETVVFEPAWHNGGFSPFATNASVGGFTGPAGPSYNTLDATGAYGTINSGATANCYDATGDCYQLQITGSRPVQHFDTAINEAMNEIALAEGPGSFDTWFLHVGGSFGDVPLSSNFYRFIETIYHRGITQGCTPSTNYCPGNTTLRQQMAVFVLKAKEGAAYLPPAAAGVFSDVAQANPFAPWIEELYNRGVVTGCGVAPLRYCPTDPVLRQQMAVFLLKTSLGSGYTPPAAAGIFADVPPASPFRPWIEDLYNRQIAAGCGGPNFCPTNPTTRGQMAPFLVKTFGLTLYGP